MRIRLLSLVAILAPSLALADVAPYHRVNNYTTYLSAVALNASSSTRTFTITNPGGGFAYANLELARTRVAGTDLTLTCVSTNSGSTPVATMGACTYDANGTCTSRTATRKSDTSSTENLAWVVRILGWKRTDCTVSSTSAGGSDLITIGGALVTR